MRSVYAARALRKDAKMGNPDPVVTQITAGLGNSASQVELPERARVSFTRRSRSVSCPPLSPSLNGAVGDEGRSGVLAPSKGDLSMGEC